MGGDGSHRHPLLGRWAPNLAVITDQGKTQVAEMMHGGKGVLLDLARRSVLHEVAANWADRVDAVAARCYDRPAKLDALLIRPDGYVAWVASSDNADQESQTGLRSALERWFGEALATRQKQRSATAQQ